MASHLLRAFKALPFRVHDDGVLIEACHHRVDVVAVEGVEVALNHLLFGGHGDFPPLDACAGITGSKE